MSAQNHRLMITLVIDSEYFLVIYNIEEFHTGEDLSKYSMQFICQKDFKMYKLNAILYKKQDLVIIFHQKFKVTIEIRCKQKNHMYSNVEHHVSRVSTARVGDKRWIKYILHQLKEIIIEHHFRD